MQTYAVAKTIHQHTICCISAIGLGMLLCSAPYAHAEGTGRIVKWKDEKGATHYGDNIPSQYVDRENSLINRQGITIKHNLPAKGSADEVSKVDTAKSEQAKKDKALLGAFTNVNEIDLALERNIQLDKIALESLKQDKFSHQKALNEKKVLAASYEKRKEIVPKDLTEHISEEQNKIDKINQQITDRNNVISATRQRFDTDKKRYILLKNSPAGTDQ